LGLPGSFRGWPIQWNHTKCCGADPCCHVNEIWTIFAQFSGMADSMEPCKMLCGQPLLPWQRNMGKVWRSSRLPAYPKTCVCAKNRDRSKLKMTAAAILKFTLTAIIRSVLHISAHNLAQRLKMMSCSRFAFRFHF